MEFLIYWHWDTVNIFGFKIIVKLWSKQSSQQLRLTLRSASSAQQHHQFKQKAFLEYRLPTTDRGSVNWTSDHLLYSLSECCWFFYSCDKNWSRPRPCFTYTLGQTHWNIKWDNIRHKYSHYISSCSTKPFVINTYPTSKYVRKIK